MCDKKNNENCLSNVLEKIILLQQVEGNTLSGCSKPFLGDIALVANTRPLNIYSCCTNNVWTMPYNFNGTTGTSRFFRVESLNDNCATFRILIQNETGYTATNSYFMINLNCIGALKCLGDALVTNI